MVVIGGQKVLVIETNAVKVCSPHLSFMDFRIFLVIHIGLSRILPTVSKIGQFLLFKMTVTISVNDLEKSSKYNHMSQNKEEGRGLKLGPNIPNSYVLFLRVTALLDLALDIN